MNRKNLLTICLVIVSLISITLLYITNNQQPSNTIFNKPFTHLSLQHISSTKDRYEISATYHNETSSSSNILSDKNIGYLERIKVIGDNAYFFGPSRIPFNNSKIVVYNRDDGFSIIDARTQNVVGTHNLIFYFSEEMLSDDTIDRKLCQSNNTNNHESCINLDFEPIDFYYENDILYVLANNNILTYNNDLTLIEQTTLPFNFQNNDYLESPFIKINNQLYLFVSSDYLIDLKTLQSYKLEITIEAFIKEFYPYHCVFYEISDNLFFTKYATNPKLVSFIINQKTASIAVIKDYQDTNLSSHNLNVNQSFDNKINAVIDHQLYTLDDNYDFKPLNIRLSDSTLDMNVIGIIDK